MDDLIFEEEEEAPVNIVTGKLCLECSRPIPTYMDICAGCEMALAEEDGYYEELFYEDWRSDDDDYER